MGAIVTAIPTAARVSAFVVLGMILAGALDQLETDQWLFSHRLRRVARRIGGGLPPLLPASPTPPIGRATVLCSAASWDTDETSQPLGGAADLPPTPDVALGPRSKGVREPSLSLLR